MEDFEGASGAAEQPAFPVVGIGASAGGLQPICELVSEIRPNSGMAFVIVQHLDPERPSLLPEILARHTSLRMVQAEDDTQLQPIMFSSFHRRRACR